MTPQTLAKRVETLEAEMEERRQVNARVDALSTQFSDVRAEVRSEFAALRKEMADGFAVVRQDLQAEMKAESLALRKEIKEGDEETRRQMRLLHEGVIARLAIIQEGLPRRRSAARRKPH